MRTGVNSKGLGCQLCISRARARAYMRVGIRMRTVRSVVSRACPILRKIELRLMWNEAPCDKHPKARSDGRHSRYSTERRDGGPKASRLADFDPQEVFSAIGLTSTCLYIHVLEHRRANESAEITTRTAQQARRRSGRRPMNWRRRRPWGTVCLLPSTDYSVIPSDV